LSGEDGCEATVAESAPVWWRWIFKVERNVHADTLALQRSSK